MHTNISNSLVEESLPNEWINWCRLCAKKDDKNNIIILNQEHLEEENKNLSVQEALAKFFWVQCSLEDSLPNMLCNDCLSLVSFLINFNERVERVQQMYLHLAETLTADNCLDFQTIRSKFDITDQDHNWLSKYSAPEKNCMDTISNVFKTEETESQSGSDTELTEQEKLENGEELLKIECDDYLEVLYDNVTDSHQEYKEDPFNSNDEEEKNFKDTSEEENDDGNEEESSPLNRTKLVPRRKEKNKKELPRTKRNKTKIDINELKMDVTCKKCGDHFSKYISYRRHLQHKHGQKINEKLYPCPSCDKNLLSLYSLQRHVRIHIPLEVRQTKQCPECDMRFITSPQLDYHIKLKHTNEMEKICEECGQSCKHLARHMLTHLAIPAFECEVCKKRFKSKSGLMRHSDIHSNNKYICNICGLQLNSRITLHNHFLVHSDKMQHKCDYCGRAFKRSKYLKTHLLAHTGLRPYSCDFCELTFTNRSSCRLHMRKKHPEELAQLEASGNKKNTENVPKLATLKAVTKAADNLKPVRRQKQDTDSSNEFICNICGLQLNSRHTLNSHFIVHSDKFPHKCDYCGRAFKRSKNLKSHLLTHTGLRPYSCDFCDLAFSNRSSCRSHMRKRHPEELALLDISGNKKNTENVPKLATLKAITKAADNVIPVIMKISSNCSSDETSNISDNDEVKQPKQSLKIQILKKK